MDEKAKVVAHPREEFVAAETHLNEHKLVASFMTDGQPHVISFVQSDGSRMLGAVQGNRLRWAVAVQQEESELYAPLRHVLAVGAGLLAFAAVRLALIARAFSGMLVRPILEMADAADAMSMGELDQSIAVSRQDELGILGRSLERLRKSMKAAMKRIGAEH